MVIPEGISPSSIVDLRDDGSASLRVQPAFAEGKTAAYVTTDVWLGIPEVWLQPLYVLVEDKSEKPVPVPAAPMLIDVNEKSLFYSPYWSVQLAVVGQLADPEGFSSTRALLDARPAIPLRAGGFDNYPITPVGFLPTPPGTHLLDPTWGFALDDPSIHPALFDGRQTQLLDLGGATFHTGSGGLVQALPFFVFVRRYADGHLSALPAPRVAGVAPLASGGSAPTVYNADTGSEQAVLGMFWTLVAVVVPDTADGFRAATHPTAVAAANAAGLDIGAFEGRVATSVACFDQTSFPAGCNWLDSQRQIEGNLEADDIIVTQVNVNSTFLSFDKAPVHH